MCVYCNKSRADNWVDFAAQQIWKLNDSIKYETEHSREEIADIILGAYRSAVATPVQAERLYSGDLWLDPDGTANFKFHIGGGGFTAARHALEKFITCLQDRLNRAAEYPSAERVLNHCRECGKDFLYSYEGTICPPCHGRIVGNGADVMFDEVTRRMDAVVDAAVAWRQSDGGGDEGDLICTAVDSLLELRSKGDAHDPS